MNTKKTFSMLATVMMFSLIASLSTFGLQQAAADPDGGTNVPDTTGSSPTVFGPNSSADVAIIGGPGIQFGGTIPTPAGPTYSNVFAASPLPSLGANGACGVPACDTVILNAASGFVNCDLSGTGPLSAADLTTLVGFLQGGGKLLIYDSECPSNDFTWLPGPLQFTTNNPGQLGAGGFAQIDDQNVLSTTGGGFPIDVINICANDQCGDANVMTALGTELCKDMSADNDLLPTFEPVHVFSDTGGASGNGLLIYNGFDYDFSGNADLQLLTLYELEAEFNPRDPAPNGDASLSIDKCIPIVVGGEFMSIDTTSLILAGAQTNAAWLLSALAVIGGVAFGAIYLKSRKN